MSYLFNVRGFVCKYLGRGVTASVLLSDACVGGRRVSIVQAYIICQRCLLSVSGSCPEPFPTHLAFSQRAQRAPPCPGFVLREARGKLRQREGSSAACLPATVTLQGELGQASTYSAHFISSCMSKMEIMGWRHQH